MFWAFKKGAHEEKKNLYYSTKSLFQQNIYGRSYFEGRWET